MLEQYEAFFAVADNKSFSKAARSLFISQSVLSRQISKLEDDIGVILFDRTKKPISLTPAGTLVYSEMKDIESRYDLLIKDAQSLQAGFKGVLRIGCLIGQSPAKNFQQPIDEFKRCYPNIKTSLMSYSFKELEEKLANGEIDVATTIVHGLFASPSFDHIEAGVADVVLVTSVRNPLAHKSIDEIDLRDFADDTFIVYDEFESRAGFTTCSDYFKNIEVTPSILKVNDAFGVSLMVETGVGHAIFNECSTVALNPFNAIVRLPGLGSVTESFIWKKEGAPAITKVFSDFLRKYYSTVQTKTTETSQNLPAS